MCELGINLGNLQEHPWEMAGIISPAPRLFKKKKKCKKNSLDYLSVISRLLTELISIET